MSWRAFWVRACLLTLVAMAASEATNGAAAPTSTDTPGTPSIEQYLREGRTQEAIAAIVAAAADPHLAASERARRLAIAARLATDIGNHRQALDLVDQSLAALHSDPPPPTPSRFDLDILVLKARILAASGSFVAAELLLKATPSLFDEGGQRSLHAYNVLSVCLAEQGKLTEALDVLTHALNHVSDDPALADLTSDLVAKQIMDLVRLDRAKEVEEVIADARRRHVASSLDFSVATAEYLVYQGQFAEADKLFADLHDRAVHEQPVDPERVANVDLVRAYSLSRRGRYIEAADVLENAYTLSATASSKITPLKLRLLRFMGGTQIALGNYDLATTYLNAISAAVPVFGPESNEVFFGLIEKAFLAVRMKDLVQARRSLRELQTIATAPARKWQVLELQGNIAMLEGKPKEAELQYDQAQVIARQENVPFLKQGFLLMYAAEAANAAEEYDKVGPLLDPLIDFYEQIGATGVGRLARALALRAEAAGHLHRDEVALADFRRAADLARKQDPRDSQDAADIPSDSRTIFNKYLQYLYVSRQQHQSPANDDEIFLIAQSLTHLGAADAVNNLMAKFHDAGDGLGALVKQRQDLIQARSFTEGLIAQEIAAVQATQAPLRKMKGDLDRIDAKLLDVQNIMIKKFPKFYELLGINSINIADIQKNLRSSEIFIFVLPADNSIYLFGIDRTSVKVERIPEKIQDLEGLVTAARREAFDEGLISQNKLPAFTGQNAYELYRLIFSPIEDMLKTASTLIVSADGPLLSLPLAMLLTAPPPAGLNYSAFPWLAKSYASTVVPSPSSFVILRNAGREMHWKSPFVGFGNPVFSGSAGGTQTSIDLEKIFPGGSHIDYSALKSLQPLPETRVELLKMREILGGDPKAVYLESAASTSNVMAADLTKYRVVAFATHGLMAGDLYGLAEPALVVTSPPNPTDGNNGLLLASQIARLKMTADWAILSACNTAASDGRPHAPGFSGLARAFLFAGARALLVSHWPVETTAAMETTTVTVAGTAAGASKAAALQTAQKKFIDGTYGNLRTHPFFWAPFVLVGDGS